MREFGSDYHYIKDLKLRNNLDYQLPSDSRYYANGRQAIQSLIHFKKWRRIWMPEYFCYEIIAAIKETGIQVMFYYDNPSINENDSISNILFRKDDVLFRMNYFGLRSKRDNSKILVPVIEDHSHDLIGEWAVNSNADWCIASLRKTLPIAEGGILWSPIKLLLPEPISTTVENEFLSKQRFNAMKLKSDYLEGKPIEKDRFLKIFNETELMFNDLNISGISKNDLSVVKTMDIESWYEQKKRNWIALSKLSHPKVEVLKPENFQLYPFSFVINFNNQINRDIVKDFLIHENIYPTILWQIPKIQRAEIIEYGNSLLSVHCDARYNEEKIKKVKKILIESFSKIH